MRGWSKEAKCRLLIKAYLSLNRNRKITSKEIATWINSTNFGMTKTNVHPNLITLLVKEGKYSGSKMMKEIKTEKIDGRTMMWLE